MLIDEAQFRRKLENLQNLPAFPEMLDKFNAMVSDPTVSLNQVGELIGQDQLLSIKILKLVNSAFYGFPGRISTVTHALVLLGYDVVKGLILSASVFDVMVEKWRPLWRHSLAVSRACGIICKKMNVDAGEEVAMAGLLHDIGKVVLLVTEPDIYAKVTRTAIKKNRPMYEVENGMLGFDHSDVAGWLCERWHLPQRLAAPMGNHHHPDRADYGEVATSVVFFADNLVKAMDFGAENGAPVEPMNPTVLKHLKISRDFLADIVKAVEPELEGISV